MTITKWISLDIQDPYSPNYYLFMDIKKYRAVCIDNTRHTVYGKDMNEAKQQLPTKVKSIYRV